MENQNGPLCVEVFAVNNEVLENRETFSVSISSSDRSVRLMGNSTSLVVFDDDSESYNIAIRASNLISL